MVTSVSSLVCKISIPLSVSLKILFLSRAAFYYSNRCGVLFPSRFIVEGLFDKSVKLGLIDYRETRVGVGGAFYVA